MTAYSFHDSAGRPRVARPLHAVVELAERMSVLPDEAIRQFLLPTTRRPALGATRAPRGQRPSSPINPSWPRTVDTSK